MQDLTTQRFQEKKTVKRKKRKQQRNNCNQVLAQKNKLREVTLYCCGNTGNILSDFNGTASTPKDKWEFKISGQHLCADSQKDYLQSVNEITVNQ